MSDPNFINDFQTSLDNLSRLNTTIADNTTNNQKEFNAHILGRLREIIQKINDLGEKIKTLKSNRDQLQNQANDNTSGINAKDAEITQLKQQIQTLTAEKDKIQQDFTASNQKLTEQIKQMQLNIDQQNVQIQKLTTENTTIQTQIANCESQLEALKNDVNTKGTATQKQHEEIIQRLTDANTQEVTKLTQEKDALIKGLQEQIQQLQAQLQTNQQQIAQLTQEIDKRNQQMAQLQKQISDATSTNGLQLEALKKSIEDCNNKITQLENENAQLKTQNADLLQRIQKATAVINSATQNLQTLSNVKIDPTEIDALLGEVEKSIAAINVTLGENGSASTSSGLAGAISGLFGTSTPAPVAPSPVAPPSYVSQHLNDQSPLAGKTYGEIIALLNNKIKSLQEQYKQRYTNIRNNLVNAKDKKAADEIIQNNIFLTTDGRGIKGGKKTRKNRKVKKQRGGFTYNLNAKRKPLTSSYRKQKSRPLTKYTLRSR